MGSAPRGLWGFPGTLLRRQAQRRTGLQPVPICRSGGTMINRREFMSVTAAALAQAAGLGQKPPVRFGVDLYSIRSQGFDAFQHLDYCSKLGAKVVHFSEIQFMGSLEEDH